MYHCAYDKSLHSHLHLTSPAGSTTTDRSLIPQILDSSFFNRPLEVEKPVQEAEEQPTPPNPSVSWQLDRVLVLLKALLT